MDGPLLQQPGIGLERTFAQLRTVELQILGPGFVAVHHLASSLQGRNRCSGRPGISPKPVFDNVLSKQGC